MLSAASNHPSSSSQVPGYRGVFGRPAHYHNRAERDREDIIIPVLGGSSSDGESESSESSEAEADVVASSELAAESTGDTDEEQTHDHLVCCRTITKP